MWFELGGFFVLGHNVVLYLVIVSFNVENCRVSKLVSAI